MFISTLAQSRLKAPQDPPQTQQDVLATALQPIVAFVVLGSILTRTSFTLFATPRLSMLTSLFTDGLSIPFFSAGRHTLTISRSAVAADPPDWLLWARRAPPQMNPDRSPTSEGADDTVVSREGPRREGRKRVEWPDQLGQTEQDDAKTPSTPSTVTKINEVLLYRLSVMHAIFLTHIFSSSRKDPPASLSGPSP